jgi:hypothetical protein
MNIYERLPTKESQRRKKETTCRLPKKSKFVKLELLWDAEGHLLVFAIRPCLPTLCGENSRICQDVADQKLPAN